MEGAIVAEEPKGIDLTSQADQIPVVEVKIAKVIRNIAPQKGWEATQHWFHFLP